MINISSLDHYLVVYEDGTTNSEGVPYVRLRMTDPYYYYGRFGGEDGPIGAFSNLKDIEIFQEPSDATEDGGAILLDAGNNKLYFISFNISSQTITFDESNGVTVGATPESMLISDGYVYTANYDDGSITQVSLTTRNVTNTIDLKSVLFSGKDFVNVRPKKLSIEGSNLLVTCDNRRGVLIIDLAPYTSSSSESESSSSSTIPFTRGDIELSPYSEFSNDDSEENSEESGPFNLDSRISSTPTVITNSDESEESSGDSEINSDYILRESATGLDSFRDTGGSSEENTSESNEGELRDIEITRDSSSIGIDSFIDSEESSGGEGEGEGEGEINFENLRDPSATNVNDYINPDESEEEDTSNSEEETSILRSLPDGLRGTSNNTSK